MSWVSRNLGEGLLLLSWAHFLNDGAANYLPSVLPLVLQRHGLPLSFAGLLMGILLIGQVLQPVCGWVADRWEGRRLVLGGLAASTLGCSLVGLAPGVRTLVGILLVVGLGNALFHPPALASLRARATARHGLAMSVFLVGGELGRGIFPMIAGILVSEFGLGALIFFAVPAIVSAPFVFAGTPSLKPGRQRSTDAPLRLKHLSPLARLIAYATLRAGVFYCLITFLPLLWEERGGSLIGGAALLSTILTVGVLGNLAGGHLSDRLGRRVVLALASTATVPLLIWLIHARCGVAYLGAALVGICLFATLPIQILIAQDMLPENRSLGSGLALGFANAGGAALTAGVGLLAGKWQIGQVMWIAVGLAVLAAALAPFVPVNRPPILKGGLSR